MSEEIELSDSLCITEDAFESFQANVAYEEEEFITLSDLVSATDNTHAKLPKLTLESIDQNLPSEPDNLDIIEITKENANGNIEGTLNSQKKEAQLTTTDNNKSTSKNTDHNNGIVETRHEPKRRGRKKKLAPKNNAASQSIVEARNTVEPQNIVEQQNMESPHKPKRGRRKKTQEPTNDNHIPNATDKNNSLDNLTSKSTNERPLMSTRKSKQSSYECAVNSNTVESTENIQIVSSTSSDLQLTPIKRRRGRPKKNSSVLESMDTSHEQSSEVTFNTSQEKCKRKKCVKSKPANCEAVTKTTEPAVNNESNINGAESNITDTNLQNSAIDSSSLLVEIEKDNSLDDEIDDICLSQLKSNIERNSDNAEKKEDTELKLNNIEQGKQNSIEEESTTSKRTSEKPVMSDFEYNIDNVVSGASQTESDTKQNELEDKNESETLESNSKRPVRRRTKQVFKYDEESDEDPFANVELSDDEPHRTRKGKYNSDDEYKPGKKYQSPESSLDSDISDTETLELSDDRNYRKRKLKRIDKGNKMKSPKKGRHTMSSSFGNNSKTDVTNNCQTEDNIMDIDIEDSLTSSVLMKNSPNHWDTTANITDYLAKKIQGTDIKIVKAKPSEKPETKFEIPVLDPNEPKKTIEMATQTNKITKVSETTQTESQQDLSMKVQVKLTPEQTEKACEFLNNIVETTAELGELMTQKSRDFIEKKINTTNVTDTFKMDYCVKKSFLLFKLAKHNLMQMEQDLESKYEEFLEENNLNQYRESKKIITPQTPVKDDSDCEIVEEVTPMKPKEKPKFNPKTVFLNKELSIKIAKAPKTSTQPTEKKNIKGRHTVWINESVMVKKVQPTQSFLAQDSRNKKPPDCVTLEMVKTFFDNYYKKEKALSICRPYISMDWLSVQHNYVCNYFVKDSDFDSSINNDLFTQSETDIDSAVSTFAVKIKASTSNGFINPKRLLTLCTESIQKHLHIVKQNNNSKIVCEEEDIFLLQQNGFGCHMLHENGDSDTAYKTIEVSDVFENNVKSLKTICTSRINRLLSQPKSSTIKIHEGNAILRPFHEELGSDKMNIYDVTSLSKLCFNIIQKYFLPLEKHNLSHSVNSLGYLAVQVINKEMTLQKNHSGFEGNQIEDTIQRDESVVPMALTINCVSTVTEEDFTSFQQPDFDSSHYMDENDESNESFDNDNFDSGADLLGQPDAEDSNWVCKVQMQELRSCMSQPVENRNELDKNNDIVSAAQCSIAQIKIEPEEPKPDANMIMVKTEPSEEEEVPVAPEHVITKQEHIEDVIDNPAEPTTHLSRRRSKTYNEDMFESFVSSNKIIKDINTSYLLNNYEIYSQSSQRVRRQYDPDSDDEINTVDDMGLLVPQSIEIAKDQLMENSSDEENNKKIGKKKVTKPLKSKKIVKEPAVKDKTPTVGNDVAILTRRMKERIRQEEKKHESSDSEKEDIPLQKRRLRHQITEKPKPNEKPQESNITTPVQCSEVDSTEQISTDIKTDGKKSDTNVVSTRRSRLRKQRISSIQEGTQNVCEEKVSPDMEFTVPPELLECEPEISIDEEPSKTKIDKNKSTNSLINDSNISDININKSKEKEFIERNGWKCYSIDPNDSKIYENASVVLDKLPESFVETYFRFQEINRSSDDDTEVNRLTNLASLTKSISKDKVHVKQRIKNVIHKKPKSENQNQDDMDDDYCAEFSPSEDDDDNPGDMQMPKVAPENAENSLAKDLLMNDNDSDSEQVDNSNASIKIKKEPGTEDEPKIKPRIGPKSKIKMMGKALNSADSVMLTADKMMNSELTLLNTPVIMKQESSTDVKDVQKPAVKNSARLSAKREKSKIKINLKEESESSSEEEKQWVFTKEKMLKRIEKKHETAIVDEAKGAKRVSEFIEKRGEASDPKSRATRGRKRSNKKMLERRKQMNVLAKELFGEQLSSRKYSQSYGKGRRNIRKVLNKQNLNHATVIANKEEFERKRRLNNRQAQLREHLGCEEGVNVVVINDELCLEYDFERNMPVVGVHKFFTKVMKAHQYEGVKFMWDACFESVSRVAGGDAGGGCILAHCMGLGKTLQVLALLHTALTHPMLNMRRVLVCCPLSTVLNWVDEIHKWIDPVTDKIKTFELSKLKRTYERAYQLEDWYNNGGIFIIGYELFRSLTTLDSEIDNVRPTYIKKIRTALLDPGPDIIVCDEGHLLKNDCSVLAVAMSRVTTKRRIVLTGTPMQNNLREYYCMVNFVKPSLLGTYSEYSNRFENPIMNGQHRDSREDDIILMKTRTHILHKVLEGCLQRQEASVLYPYLPKKYEYTVFIPLTKCQRDMYKHYLHCYASKGKQMVLKDFHTLQKIWTHPQVLHNFQTRAREEENKKIKAEKIEDDLAQEDIAADVKPPQTEVWWLQYLEGGNMLHALESSNKFHVVFRLLDECVALGDKVLIFSTSLYTMDALEHFLRSIKQWSLGQEYYRLDGSVPADVRQKWCREFNAENNDRTKLFLVSTRAGCLGLNMTAANRVIILDTSWNPAHDIQSIFRVYRFGQKKDCYIYRLVAMGTMEQKIYERSVTKQAVACRVVDEQQIDRHFNSTDLTELYSWDSEGWGVLAGMAPGVRDAALLRVAAGGALHAVREHDSLLRGSEPALPEHERNAAWHQFQLEHAHQNTQVAPVVPSVAKKQMPIPESQPSTSNDITTPSTSGKTKKGKNSQKSKNKTAPVEESPPEATPDLLPPDKEEVIVKKIMQILIVNKFHETIQAEDLTKLIVNVRRLVSSRMNDSELLKDPIAASIASVLLQDDNDNTDSEAPNQPIIADHQNAVEYPEVPVVNLQKPVGNNKKKSVVNKNENSISDDHEKTVINNRGKPVVNYQEDQETPKQSHRRKRVSKPISDVEIDDLDDDDNFDVNDDDNFDANDDDDVEWTCDSKETKTSKAKEKKNKAKRSQRDKNVDSARKTEEKMEVEVINTTDTVPQSDSILISDDDDETLVKPQVQKPSKKEKQKEKESAKVPKKKRERKILMEEIVPLHPLILSNENFIKIVAHMYQRGNSMLSDDAAKMAAQYSTNKARSEYEATGVPITSGPLYEIAIESLGLEQLRKMHKSIQADAKQDAAKASTSKEPQNDDDVQVVEPPRVVPPKPAGPRSRRKAPEPPEPPPPPVEKPPEPQPQNVFPVGMFQFNKSQQVQVIEECILPDDDDDIIIGPEVRTVVKPPTSQLNNDKVNVPLVTEPSKPVTSSGRKKQRTTVPTITVDAGVPFVSVAENIVSQRGNEPICLSDSDDDASPQPLAPTQMAIPLSMAQPQVIAQYHTMAQPQAKSQPLAMAQPHPVALIPMVPPPPATPTPSSEPALRVPPLVLKSASFKGGTPYVLSSNVQKMLDPSKKYYCIPSSSLNNAKATNPAVPVPSPSDVQKPATPSIVITSLGAIHLDGTSPCQTDASGQPHVIISTSPSTNPPIQRKNKSERIELSNTKVYSSRDNKNVTSRGGSNVQPNQNKSNAQTFISTPSTSGTTLKLTLATPSKTYTNPQVSPRAKPPTPTDDHSSLFKGVVRIQADAYKDVPPPQIQKTVTMVKLQKPAKTTLPSILKRDQQASNIQQRTLTKLKSIDIGRMGTDRPVAISKSSAPSTAKKGSLSNPILISATTSEELRKKKLIVLKKLEQVKYDAIPGDSKSKSNVKGIKVDRSGGKNMATSTFIDLTDVTEQRPRVEKRPAPFAEKSVKKQKKLLTLADFNLDDIDDITELE